PLAARRALLQRDAGPPRSSPAAAVPAEHALRTTLRAPRRVGGEARKGAVGQLLMRPLRGAAHVGEQARLDLLDDRQRLVPVALPDVAAEDHATAARLHPLGGVAEDDLVVGFRATGEDDQRPTRRLDAVVD